MFLEGFRPGVAERLGMGFESLSELNPRLVYCSISGYGQTGPNRLLSGHNVNYEAVVGVLDAYLRPDLGVSYFSAAPAARGHRLGDHCCSGYRRASRHLEARKRSVNVNNSTRRRALALQPRRALNHVERS